MLKLEMIVMVPLCVALSFHAKLLARPWVAQFETINIITLI